MRKDQPFISIITLNYNQTDVTCDFLASTRNLKYRNFEILVCDMASAVDPTPKIETGNYPNTRLLLSKENLGFAGGNNWGMRQAKGDFMFIVNNDTVVTDNLLDELLKPFYEDDSIGVTCPKIKYFDQPNVIQYAGFNPMNNFTGRTTSIGTHEEDKGQYDTSGITYGAHGCAMLVKKEVIEQVGMFPEKFFLYYEEWDWSARILKAGFKIWYTAPAVIYHKESLSVGKANPMKVYYHTRNRILYMRRNARFFPLLVFTIYFGLFAVPKNTISYLLKKQFTHLKFFLKGAAWNLYSSSYSPV
ncbi:glycosyltransferase family 2 protein [Pseudoflavitalea sp. X16]|uniref:glycosyltransferase family 2 protein n=1 Tax=Paraflavitalea devenefica TaxID=2716334 RepID=UPI001421554C|nr:glycosyltransferase family 2 protein [Paraflavitalea devenefica]NII23647.1 glycosyltransferase family 2 protein [Paraflavitalea devenefica]